MRLEFKTVKAPREDCTTKNAFVFIDYESIFVSFSKHYSVAPPLGSLFDEIKSSGKIARIRAFGDFSKPDMSQERNRIRTITSDIIDCGHESAYNKKDYTDFIMLDHIYQEAIQNPQIEQYIIFTGDGHFASAATFLRTHMDKLVGIYGVDGTLSNQLRECASWVKSIRAIDDDITVYRDRLLKNLERTIEGGKIPSFMKTVEHAARTYGGDYYLYERALAQLIEEGYISREVCTAFPDREFMMLVPDWDKMKRELVRNSNI